MTSPCEQAGLGEPSRSTASRICAELKEHFEAFKRRDLYDTRLVALFLDATFISVRRLRLIDLVRSGWLIDSRLRATVGSEATTIRELRDPRPCQVDCTIPA